MEKEFVPYTEALDLKELGFDEPCFGYRESTYGKDRVIIDNSKLITNSNFSKVFSDTHFRIVTPTYSQAFRWFREKGIYENIIYDWNDEVFRVTIMIQKEDKYCVIIYLKEDDYIKEYKDYEEAELECLRKLIEIVKNER